MNKHFQFAIVCTVIVGVMAVIALISVYNVETRLIPPDAVLPDGSQYYGDSTDGRFHGEGKLVWPNGAVYRGEFSEGLMSGEGELTTASGDRYEGEFKEGMMHGIGVYKSTAGDIYKGEFIEDSFSGTGTMTDAAGNHYAGEFEHWWQHGRGVYKPESGEVYKGEFVDGEFTGKGVYITADDGRYTGTFENWMLQGRGEYQGADGEHYTGDFRDGVYHGEGTLVDPDGNRYEGGFKYGYKHGEGTMTYAAPGDDTDTVTGRWEYGRFVDPDAEQRRAELHRRIENALYSQNRLLDEALSRVASGEQGEIELFFAGVAGFSDQDVFLKEIRFVKNLLDREYGTAGRSLALINHRDTLEDTPLATRTALEKALRGIAERMNRDEDILFLYMTSHGSEDHRFSLYQDGIAFADLGAEALGEVVNALPVKWKVIVVSACYSGGYIPPIESDTTLVMTAARKDRKSFGCSDQSDMTYFGKAYFEDALPTSSSFVEAFAKAQALIRKREKTELEQQGDIVHSEPQMAAGGAIIAHLEKWRTQRNAREHAADQAADQAPGPR